MKKPILLCLFNLSFACSFAALADPPTSISELVSTIDLSNIILAILSVSIPMVSLYVIMRGVKVLMNCLRYGTASERAETRELLADLDPNDPDYFNR